MNKELIAKTEAFLRSKFDQGAYFATHLDAKSYRLEHTYRVANIGRQIALAEGFDPTEMVIACLLHDVSYCEDFGADERGWIEHGRRAAAIARPFLVELGFAADRIEDICYGIAIHVDDNADFAGVRTPFALSVGDADNIDRFDVYRIHETLSKEGFLTKSYEDKVDFVTARLSRLGAYLDMPMATPTATALWRERLSFYVDYYDKLLAQLEASKSISAD